MTEAEIKAIEECTKNSIEYHAPLSEGQEECYNCILKLTAALREKEARIQRLEGVIKHTIEWIFHDTKKNFVSHGLEIPLREALSDDSIIIKSDKNEENK